MRRWTPEDTWHFRAGTHDRLYEVLGAFAVGDARGPGTLFRMWAPGVTAVCVVGDFNGWRTGDTPLVRVEGTDIFEVRVPGVTHGDAYKYRLQHAGTGAWAEKADPFARWSEAPPATASRVCHAPHRWTDKRWLANRQQSEPWAEAVSIYEVHLGSWARDEAGQVLTYPVLAERLAAHVTRLGFTHVELMPVMEHPYDPSWGYQVTGFLAPTARFGTPADFKAFVDILHGHGIGVILDWVPAHFPTDAHGLYRYNGEAVFEHPDPRRGFHPDWTTAIFDYERPEVRSFLLSSAAMWLDRFHVDGLRVDAVASMLYLDYSRQGDDWIPNAHGGRENLGAIELLRTLNVRLGDRWPKAMIIAEESTAWPGVSRPVSADGLGFGFKWDMGWMNDTLRYLQRDTVHRQHHHNELTFRPMYQYAENFVLPLSHDEVVHGKGSLLDKMPGDAWQRFANLRLLLASQYTLPGKKLLFMGTELALPHEWRSDESLPWHLQDLPGHAGILRVVAALNALYRHTPALHTGDVDEAGFAWIDWSDAARSVLSWLRIDPRGGPPVAVVANYTETPHRAYPLGVPSPGAWEVVFNSDAATYGGSDFTTTTRLSTFDVPAHDHPQSLSIDVPPLAVIVLAPR